MRTALILASLGALCTLGTDASAESCQHKGETLKLEPLDSTSPAVESLQGSGGSVTLTVDSKVSPVDRYIYESTNK